MRKFLSSGLPNDSVRLRQKGVQGQKQTQTKLLLTLSCVLQQLISIFNFHPFLLTPILVCVLILICLVLRQVMKTR